MNEYLTVTMKSGRTHNLIIHTDESFLEFSEKIIDSMKYFVSNDIIINISEIESIERGK